MDRVRIGIIVIAEFQAGREAKANESAASAAS